MQLSLFYPTQRTFDFSLSRDREISLLHAGLSRYIFNPFISDADDRLAYRMNAFIAWHQNTLDKFKIVFQERLAVRRSMRKLLALKAIAFSYACAVVCFQMHSYKMDMCVVCLPSILTLGFFHKLLFYSHCSKKSMIRQITLVQGMEGVSAKGIFFVSDISFIRVLVGRLNTIGLPQKVIGLFCYILVLWLIITDLYHGLSRYRMLDRLFIEIASSLSLLMWL